MQLFEWLPNKKYRRTTPLISLQYIGSVNSHITQDKKSTLMNLTDSSLSFVKSFTDSKWSTSH